MTNELISKLDALERKLLELVKKHSANAERIIDLEKELKEKDAQLQEQIKMYADLKQNYEHLNIGKAFGGSEGSNSEAKKKIDKLIKEINLCIAEIKE